LQYLSPIGNLPDEAEINEWTWRPRKDGICGIVNCFKNRPNNFWPKLEAKKCAFILTECRKHIMTKRIVAVEIFFWHRKIPKCFTLHLNCWEPSYRNNLLFLFLCSNELCETYDNHYNNNIILHTSVLTSSSLSYHPCHSIYVINH
jgi:hypothetical protein